MLDRYGRIILMAAVLALMALPARALARHDGFGHDDDDRFYFPGFYHHDRGLHLGWYKHHHRFDRDDFVVCDEDGDDCRPVRRRFPPFGQPLRFRGLSGTPDRGLLAERANLVFALNSAQAQYYAALQRGDRRGAKHYLHAVQKLEGQVAALDSQVGAFPGYDPAYYYGTSAIPGAYGVYPLNPTAAAVTALIPLLQAVHP